MSKIDFTRWTDAQLNQLPGQFQTAETLAEIERRKAAGTWLKDGSTERVAKLIRSSTTRKPKQD